MGYGAIEPFLITAMETPQPTFRKSGCLATRRGFFGRLALASASVVAADVLGAGAAPSAKPHLVTLSFDDGFERSFRRIAEIYEKFGLSAGLNVVAAGLTKDAYIQQSPAGGFELWNELQARGHEVMPHGYRHANLKEMPLPEAKDLVRRCLDLFGERLKGFDPKRAVFNFPYNASTPELERWLASEVMAFRTSGPAINPLPHAGQVRLTCTSYGPSNCEVAVDRAIEGLLALESGWLIFNTHGLDEEGWGPMRSDYLERLLERLTGIDSVRVVPAGRALHPVVSVDPRPGAA